MIPYTDDATAVQAAIDALHAELVDMAAVIGRMGDALVLAVEGEDYLVEDLPSWNLSVPEPTANAYESLRALAEYITKVRKMAEQHEPTVLGAADKVSGILSGPMGVMLKRMMGL